MKGRIGKLSVLMVALLVAVGAMGAGFASWTDTLTIDGTVTTADFQVGIVDIVAMDIGQSGELYDAGPNYLEDGGALLPENRPVDGTADPQYGPGNNAEGKNVASTNSYNDPYDDGVRFEKTVLSPGGTAVTHSFYGAVREEIHNAYPWYASGVALGIGNAGDIPVHIVDIDFNPVDPMDCDVLAWLELHSWEAWVYTSDATPVEEGSGSGIASLEEFLSGWPNGVPFQLEPCEMLYLELFWHFEQDVDVDGDGDLEVMPQNADCEFDITIDVQQWAE